MSASGAPGRRLRNLSVQGWFRLVFTVLGLLVVAAVLAVVALTARTRGISNEVMNSIQPAQAQAYRLQGALVDQETGVRGYAITADPRFLQPYTSGRATEQAADAKLRSEVGREQPLAADLGRLERAADGWRAALRPPADQPGPGGSA